MSNAFEYGTIDPQKWRVNDKSCLFELLTFDKAMFYLEWALCTIGLFSASNLILSTCLVEWWSSCCKVGKSGNLWSHRDFSSPTNNHQNASTSTFNFTFIYQKRFLHQMASISCKQSPFSLRVSKVVAFVAKSRFWGARFLRWRNSVNFRLLLFLNDNTLFHFFVLLKLALDHLPSLGHNDDFHIYSVACAA